MGNFISRTGRRIQLSKQFPFVKVLRENSGSNEASTSAASSEKRLIYIALFDYNARTAEDLTFKKGEKMEIINNKDGGWWQARSVSSGEHGYVPSNYIAPATSLQTEE